jgi:hypothetical protein
VLRWLLAVACLGVAAAGSAAPPSTWPVRHYVRWQAEWGTGTIRASGLRARIDVKWCGKDRPASEACGEGSPYLVATVDAAGMRPVTVTGPPGIGGFVGIGRLTPRARRPSLILISEAGGSGGCVRIDLVVPRGAAYRAVRLSVGKDDNGTLCEVDPARLAWPSDLTGRGRPEFLLRDIRFHCHFTSCAGTWYPPEVVAFDGRRGIDVSADPALAPLYRADGARARQACEHDESEAEGPCAGYAADAARLGQLPQAWRVIRAQVRRGCRVPVSGVCPAVNRIPETFPAELAPMLPGAGRR